MQIPPVIRILGFDWDIKEDKHVAHEGGIFGSTHTFSQTIFLDPAAPQQKKEQTLLHEMMHAIWWQTGLNKRYTKEKEIIEEEIIGALAQGLYQILKDNDLKF